MLTRLRSFVRKRQRQEGGEGSAPRRLRRKRRFASGRDRDRRESPSLAAPSVTQHAGSQQQGIRRSVEVVVQRDSVLERSDGESVRGGESAGEHVQLRSPPPPPPPASVAQHSTNPHEPIASTSSNPGHTPRASDDYRAKLLRYREPDIDELDEDFLLSSSSLASVGHGERPHNPSHSDSDTDTDLEEGQERSEGERESAMSRVAPSSQQSQIRAGLENWDDDFLDQSSPSSSPRLPRAGPSYSHSASASASSSHLLHTGSYSPTEGIMHSGGQGRRAGAGSGAAGGGGMALKPRNSMDSAVWDLSSSEDERPPQRQPHLASQHPQHPQYPQHSHQDVGADDDEDLEFDDDEEDDKDPFPGALTPGTSAAAAPAWPGVPRRQQPQQQAQTPRATSPRTPTFPPPATNFLPSPASSRPSAPSQPHPTSATAAGSSSRSPALPAFNFPPSTASPSALLQRRSTRDSRASSRFEDSDGEAFYTPRDTLLLEPVSPDPTISPGSFSHQQAAGLGLGTSAGVGGGVGGGGGGGYASPPGSSGSHYRPTTDPRDSGSRYDPTPEPGYDRYARSPVGHGEEYGVEGDDEDEYEEGEGDRTVTMPPQGFLPGVRPARAPGHSAGRRGAEQRGRGVEIESEEESDYERDVQARYAAGAGQEEEPSEEGMGEEGVDPHEDLGYEGLPDQPPQSLPQQQPQSQRGSSEQPRSGRFAGLARLSTSARRAPAEPTAAAAGEIPISALPSSTSPPPPPSPTTASRSRSQLGHTAGRPSIGGGSSIFSHRSNQPLMRSTSGTTSAAGGGGKQTAPPSRYPTRPIGKENERPRRRLRKKSRPGAGHEELVGMVELPDSAPSAPASASAMGSRIPVPSQSGVQPRGRVPVPHEAGEEETDRAETPFEPELGGEEDHEHEVADAPPLPSRPVRSVDGNRPTPYTVPSSAAPSAQQAQQPHYQTRSMLPPPSSSASSSTGAFLTRLSSITRLFPRSASSTSFRRDPPIASGRQPGRAASASPTGQAGQNGHQPPSSSPLGYDDSGYPSTGIQGADERSTGPMIPGLPVASAAAANAALGHRRGKGSAPPLFVGDRERADEMFGLRRRGDTVPAQEVLAAQEAAGGQEEGGGMAPPLGGDVVGAEQAFDQGEMETEKGQETEREKPKRKSSWRKSGKSIKSTREKEREKEKLEHSERETERERTERPRSATVSGALPVPVPAAPSPPPPVPPVPTSYVPPPSEQKKEKRKPRKLSQRKHRVKEEAIKHARDSLEGHALPDVVPQPKKSSRQEEIPALPTLPSGKSLDLRAREEPEEVGPVARTDESGAVYAGDDIPDTRSSPSSKRAMSPYAPRASSPLSSAPQSRAMSPTTPISPAKTSSGAPMEKKGSQTSELKIPHRISVQQRTLKEGLTDVRQFAGVVEDLRDLQTQHATLLRFLTASTSAGPPVSRLPRAARRSSAASQHQIEAGLARLESARNEVWWELAGVLVDLGGNGNSGSVRAAKNRIGSRITAQSGEDEDRGTMSATEAEPSRRSTGPSPSKSRMRSASAAPSKSILTTSPSSPALPSALDGSGPFPRSSSLNVERTHRGEDQTPKELSSRQLVLLGEMLRESNTDKVVDYGERSKAGGRSRAASAAGMASAGPATAPSSRPPTQQSFNASTSGPPERIGRPRRGSKIVANIRDIFGGRKNRDSVDMASELASDAEAGNQGTPTRRGLRSSSRPPTIQPKGGSRQGSMDNRASPRKPSLGSIFGSRQSQEKANRSLPPTISPKQGRRAGNGSSTSIDTDLGDESEWNSVEHGNDGVATLRGRGDIGGTGTNTITPTNNNGASKQPLAIQTAFDPQQHQRERTPSMRSVERPPLASAKLALTPENIRPLLSHARAVKGQLEGVIAELRALQPPRGDMKL